MDDYLKLPETFEEFSEARKNGFIRVKKIKEEGGLIAGVFCTYTPLEILDAAGLTAVGLCGMSNETIPAAESELPKNLCPLIKSSYGFALSDKCPYTYFSDIIIGETTCDGKKKMYELLGEIKDTYIIQLPQGQDRAYSAELWTKELRRLIRTLEEKFGVEITDEKLRSAVCLRNDERKAKTELMELSRLQPPPLRGLDLYKVLEGSGFVFDIAASAEAMQSTKRKALEKYEAGDRPVSKNAKRILVTGCPIGGVLEKTVGTIESSGGVVVCFENCGGVKATRELADAEADDIVQEISRRYLNIGCAIMTPNQNRVNLIRSLVDEYHIDGVVEILLQACHPYTVEAHTIRRLSSEIGMPYLGIETDYSNTDTGQLSTRIEAFMEML
ncbi:MAG: hypothetical protein CVU91_05530 [Firmicutes bacterium HGW-Firmicutes-16]|nr:MAG: hypothetical protein CVU91_05530 [Firmicutes bacterium HGW-Firmicutes-16]